MFQAWLVFLFVTYNALLSVGMIIDVRLVNGPSRYEGTVDYTTDNVTWQTTCGVNFGFHDVRLVCEHIGAYGTNRAITDSPFGSVLDLPTTFLNCQEVAEPPTTTTGDVEISQVPELSQPTTTSLTTTEVLDTAPVAPTTSANEQSTTTGLTTVSSTHGEDGTKPDSTTCICMICPTQSTQMYASPSNGSSIGLGVVVLLLVIYSITLTFLHLKLRRSPREKQPLEGVKPEGDTYTDLDIQLHSATPETRGPLYQDLLPIEGAAIQPNKSQANGTDTDDGCYVNQQTANQQKAMRQRTKPGGDLQEYEDIV